MNEVIPLSIWRAGMINCFLIKGKKKHVLVDTGVPNSEKKIIKQLAKHDINKKDIGLIIVTHAHIDHFGSANNLKQLLNIPILAHHKDVQSYVSGKADVSTMKPNKPQWWIFKQLIKNQKAEPFQPDILIKGDAEYDLKELGINGKVVHTPGHTPGSLSVVLENGEVIIMDMMASGILLGGIVLKNRVKHPPFHDDLTELKKSFEKILSENGKRYYLGHGGPVDRTKVIKYYDKFLNKRRQQKIICILKEVKLKKNKMIRKSTAVWNGTGKEGSGMLSSTSGVLNDTPYSFASRFTNEDGKSGTNPEELIAAAHAGCFSMALSFQLEAAGFPPTRLKTEAKLSMEKNDGSFKISSIHLICTGEVENISEEKFTEIANEAKKNCPVSQALSAIEITLTATLDNQTK